MTKLQKAAPPAFSSEVNLVDRLITEQQTLTAVEQFARRHEEGALPAQARYYQDLVPLSKPAPGQQYAFAVDLDACSGCKACVSACHSLNGLEEHETWRDVGLLIGERSQTPYLQTVTTACHHCLDPACLEGCPVMAYEKDADTGIVRHLDDQCIGCQYCTLKCPYGVPKYSERLGIVRKCDMCHTRLAAGEAPACVQACPHGAIAIRLVDVAEVSTAASPGTAMLPGAFDSSYTKPTTHYHSDQPAPQSALPADARKLRLEHAHWPLLMMLVLTQWAAGLFVAAALTRTAELPLLVAGLAILSAGLFAAVFHLGRPLGAWRFFLGLRTSWMSREILAFSLMAGAAFGAGLAAFFQPGSPMTLAATAGTALLGLIAVFTSAMIYIDTRRVLWRPLPTLARFYGTTLLLGTAGAAVVFDTLGLEQASTRALAAAVFAHAAAFGASFASFIRAGRRSSMPDYLSTLTLRCFLPWLMPARAALLVVASGAAGFAVFHSAPWGAGMALIAAFASQLLERLEFYTTVRAPNMPGGV